MTPGVTTRLGKAGDFVNTHVWQPAVMAELCARALGPFLGGEADSPWATAMADRLRRRLLRQVMQVGLHWERTGEWQKAADYYANALRVDSCAEEASRRLMIACHHLGRAAEVEAAYRCCREALAARLGVTPSPETQTLLRSLHAG